MRTKILTTALLLAMTGAPSYARHNMDLVKANYYYEHLAFGKALPYYEKLAQQNGTTQVCFRLADCYRLTGNVAGAAEWYKKVLDAPSYGDVVMLRYAQMLMQLSQYEEAEKWLTLYQSRNLNDKRVANMIKGCRTAPTLLHAPHKEPVLLEFNTDRAEFGPTLWNGNLVFTSDTAIASSKKKSKWTGGACYSICSVAADDNGNCGTELKSIGTTKNIDIQWHSGPATFNALGDTMYFTRTKFNEKFYSRGSVANRDSIVVLETMIATDFNEADQKFRKVYPFTFNNQSYSVSHPSISPNGRMLVFSANQHGGSDLYLCTRNKNGKWNRPQGLGPAINTEGEEVFPWFANDTTLVFASDGQQGLGGLDVYIAHWDDTLKTFVAPTNAGLPINSPYDDISMALHPDGSSGYFSSNRPAEKGGDNVYYFKK